MAYLYRGERYWFKCQICSKEAWFYVSEQACLICENCWPNVVCTLRRLNYPEVKDCDDPVQGSTPEGVQCPSNCGKCDC
jgi:hypothetical protein